MSVTALAPRDGEVGSPTFANEQVSELIEHAGRAAGLLALREAQLAAVRHGPQLRRAALDVVVALGSALALLTAFALANWAAVSALSGPLPGWAAPLPLAAVWIVVGILLLVPVLRTHVELQLTPREQARDQAQQAMRESLERLTGGVGDEAAVQVSAAVVPVARGVVGAGEHLIHYIDEITDDLGETVPGGGVINRVADMALVPGRYVVSVARTALDGLGDELKLPGQPREQGAGRLRNTSGRDRRPGQ